VFEDLEQVFEQLEYVFEHLGSRFLHAMTKRMPPMTPSERLAAARLALEGLSIGDAFGERFFGPRELVLARIESRSLPPAPWRYTDDTEMAISIVKVLAAHGCIEQDTLARRFLERFAREPDRGYGGGASSLLRDLCLGGSWRVLSPALFDGQVDVVNRDGLKPYVKPAATADAIYAF